MIRGLPTTIMCAVLAGAVGVGLFFIKHEVKEQEARLAELNEEVLRNQEVIHVLKAEWSYLNDPARLRSLSEKFLSMKVMGPAQIATLNSMPVSGVVMAANRPTPAPAVVAKAEPTKPAAAAAPVKVAAAAAAPVKVAAAAPAPQPPKPVAASPVKPVFVAPPTKVAQSPAPLPAPAQAPARTIVIQSPALASTPALPGEVR